MRQIGIENRSNRPEDTPTARRELEIPLFFKGTENWFLAYYSKMIANKCRKI